MNRGGFMAIGIIYIMSTVVPGLIKIGKTGIDNFERRMYNLERHGYNNVVGLKREFAIELDDYDEKEKLLDDIFSKSRVLNSELFALDLDLVIQLKVDKFILLIVLKKQLLTRLQKQELSKLIGKKFQMVITI